MSGLYLRTTTRRRLIRVGEVAMLILIAFVVLAPRLDEWGLVQPLIDAMG